LLAEHSSGPVTAESDVEDDVVISKMVVGAVTTEGEVSVGLAPVAGVGVSVEDITGYGITGEVPSIDESIDTFHDVNTSSLVIKVVSVRARLVQKNTATFVTVDIGITVQGLGRATHITPAGHSTATSGV